MVLMGLMASSSLIEGAAIADEGHDLLALAQLLPSAKITLQRGMTVSEKKGQPISGKYQVEGRRLRLVIYTANGATIQEIAVDYTTGNVTQSDPVSEADTLSAAKAQLAAMAKATTTLKEAVVKAEQDFPGYRAVSAVPLLKHQHPFAMVMLVKGTYFKAVPESLE